MFLVRLWWLEISKAKDEITVYVRSRKVPVGLSEIKIPNYTMSGKTDTRKTVTIYETVLDVDQDRILKQASDLARFSGLPLDVVDVSKMNLVERLFRRVSGWLGSVPSVVLPGGLLMDLANQRRTVGNLHASQSNETLNEIQVLQ